jgi:hypothetical protein
MSYGLAEYAGAAQPAGDYLEAFAFQDSGGALNTFVGDGMSIFAATWIGTG